MWTIFGVGAWGRGAQRPWHAPPGTYHACRPGYRGTLQHQPAAAGANSTVGRPKRFEVMAHARHQPRRRRGYRRGATRPTLPPSSVSIPTTTASTPSTRCPTKAVLIMRCTTGSTGHAVLFRRGCGTNSRRRLSARLNSTKRRLPLARALRLRWFRRHDQRPGKFTWYTAPSAPHRAPLTPKTGGPNGTFRPRHRHRRPHPRLPRSQRPLLSIKRRTYPF